MSWRLAAPLAEALDLLERKVITRQMQQAVQQCRAMPRGQHEAVAIGPVRIVRVVLEPARPQHVGHRCGAERHARVPAVRLLHHVDGKEADRVDALAVKRIERGLRTRVRLNDAHDAPACESSFVLDAICCMSARQDLLNASAPSRCRRSARAASSTPALRQAAITAAESPPSSGNAPLTVPRSANASNVLSGIVLIVSGAASASMYNVSEAAGSLVPVLANNRRCGCAPAAVRAIQRGE